MSRKGATSSKRHQATMEKHRVGRESVRSKFGKSLTPEQKKSTGPEELVYKKDYSYTITYTPSNDESAWLASEQDFEKGNNGIYIFVGLQAAAAASLTAYGWYAKDPGSMITGGANLVRNGLWLGAHMGLKKVPDMRVAFHRAGANTLLKTNNLLEKFDCIKDNTKGLRKDFRRKARGILKDAKAIKAPYDEKYASQMYRDKKRAQINSIGAGSGAIVHIPQILMSSDILVQVGASLAAGAYAFMSRDQYVEASRWDEWYQKASPEGRKNFTYNHEDAHMLVGYASNGEIAQDVALKWLPPALLAGKGGSYGAEAYVLASHGASMGSVTTLAASSVIFTASALYEFGEQNSSKMKYLYNRYVKKAEDEKPDLGPDLGLTPYQYGEVEVKTEIDLDIVKAKPKPDDIEHGPS